MTTAARTSNKVTKIEVVVLVIIFAAVFSLLLPAMVVSRDVAREDLCRRNLRWLDQAAQEYIEGHRELPNEVTWTADLLPYLMGKAGEDKHRVGFEIFKVRRPMYLTCPSRPDIARVDGIPQTAHYTMVIDPDKHERSVDRNWRFQDRPLQLSEEDNNQWYMGSHRSFAEAEQELRSLPGPHRNGAYLESDSQGNSTLREMQP